MAKAYYTDYASHAMRYFARNQDKLGNMHFRSNAEMMDWNACIQTMGSFDNDQKSILLELYCGWQSFPENVARVSKERGIAQSTIWAWNNDLLEVFAKNRGLI